MPTTRTTRTADQRHRQAIKQLRDLLKRPDSSLMWHYQAGALVLQLVPEKAQSERYGKARIIRLHKKLKLPDHREKFLYAVREFAAQFKPADLKRLQGLSWSHVHFLLGVRDPQQRGRLVKKCLRKKVSCKALLQLIYELRPHRPTGGRRPADPKPLLPKAALKETVRLTDQWVRECSCWLDGIAPALKKAAPQRKPDPRLVALVNDAESALKKLSEEVARRQEEVAKWQKALRKLKLQGR